MYKATTDHHLPALQMHIEIPHCVDVKETYLDESMPGHATWSTTFDHTQRRWTLELQWGIERNLYTERGLLFVRGHEEGHLCENTGNWARLYDEADQLGLKYDFFTREEAAQSDECIRMLLKRVAKRGRPFHSHLYGSLCEAEKIAHVAGMVALVKAERHNDLTRRIDKELRRVSFSMPKVPQIILEYCARTPPEANH